ncbi:hypothetical protein BDZ90DRAFT_171770 [Jaminaea rosea]|uniref:Uncharacterized protein n=1 Tax=Jaminaea rosea TaxID=1569628 RepID=A0A316UTY4_9BASI|nr:hypothetical protein BDZ90DRAFT_171770 [Jaminaea rosea]PWN27781.1 hypothetical protein BDZ90DRAFT_171770 [Jaminaea rosea]
MANRAPSSSKGGKQGVMDSAVRRPATRSTSKLTTSALSRDAIQPSSSSSAPPWTPDEDALIIGWIIRYCNVEEYQMKIAGWYRYYSSVWGVERTPQRSHIEIAERAKRLQRERDSYNLSVLPPTRYWQQKSFRESRQGPLWGDVDETDSSAEDEEDEDGDGDGADSDEGESEAEIHDHDSEDEGSDGKALSGDAVVEPRADMKPRPTQVIELDEDEGDDKADKQQKQHRDGSVDVGKGKRKAKIQVQGECKRLRVQRHSNGSNTITYSGRGKLRISF